MTNSEIITRESARLMQEGILKGSGVFDDNGNEYPQIIHTYAVWKRLGFQVKKGEKAIAKFPIWKHKGYEDDMKEVTDDDLQTLKEKTRNHERMFLVNTGFFTIDQCEECEGGDETLKATLKDMR